MPTFSPGGSIVIKKLVAYFSAKYHDQDFVTQQKVRVVTMICLAILPSIAILLLSQIFVETTDTTISVLITSAGGLTVLFILLGIRKGHFSYVAHMLPISALGTTWAVMLFEQGGIVERLDTVAMAIGFLSFTSLVITRRT